VSCVRTWRDDGAVADSLTYYAALQILGKPKSRLVTLLDAVATAGLTAWAAGALVTGRDAGTPFGLLELKNEVVRYGQDVVGKVSEWRSGLARFDRSQRLAAAHSVLVVASYFEALEWADLPVPPAGGRCALSRRPGRSWSLPDLSQAPWTCSALYPRARTGSGALRTVYRYIAQASAELTSIVSVAGTQSGCRIAPCSQSSALGVAAQ
jgi:hypothetical protein